MPRRTATATSRDDQRPVTIIRTPPGAPTCRVIGDPENLPASAKAAFAHAVLAAVDEVNRADRARLTGIIEANARGDTAEVDRLTREMLQQIELPDADLMVRREPNDSNKPDAELLTMKQTMALLQFDDETVHDYRRHGILKAAKVGRGKTSPWRFSRKSVMHLAENPRPLPIAMPRPVRR